VLRHAPEPRRLDCPRLLHALLPVFSAGLLLVACGGPAGGGPQFAEGGAGSRVERRTLSDRPPLAVLVREGDPENALAFASLAAAAADAHATLGEVLQARLTKAGFFTQIVSHGLGFELTLLAEDARRARLGAQALLQALRQPIGAAELAGLSRAKTDDTASPPTAADACSAVLRYRHAFTDPSEIERDRVATFARDRSALAVVGTEAAATAVADALAAGPDWPELGKVRSTLPNRSLTQVVHAERAGLSVGLTFAEPSLALRAAFELRDPEGPLALRLASLGGGLRLHGVTATTHPSGVCLRVDSDLDSSPLPDVRRLGFAVHTIEQESGLAMAEYRGEGLFGTGDAAAADPRTAARAAAYHALIEPDAAPTRVRVVTLLATDEAPAVPALEAAVARAEAERPALDAHVHTEAKQPGTWALVMNPCAQVAEGEDNAGQAALVMTAAAAGVSEPGIRVEPWIGADGVGLVGFAERRSGDSGRVTAERLADALGHALIAPPSAAEVANARGDSIKTLGSDAHPLLDALLQTLAPGHFGALAPRGSVVSLQAASREAVLLRQRELLRQPHRVAVFSPTNSQDGSALVQRLGRWLKSPDPLRNSPCESEIAAPLRSEIALGSAAEIREGSYLGFRLPRQAALEASALAELLNLPGGALAQALAEPELLGVARALTFGTRSARVLVVQVSAFAGREAEALLRVQKLLERVASGGVLVSADIERALERQRQARRLAALDPRVRLLDLLNATPALADVASIRKLAASLRPEAAVVARPGLPVAAPRR